MSNPVNVSDLEARFRSLTDAEQATAQALLDDAWAELLAHVPDLEARRTAGLDDALIVRVATAMALRVLRNPDAIKQWQIDDASFTRDGSVSSGALYASSAEVALLTGKASANRRGAFSITPPEAETTSYYGSSASDAALLYRLRYGTCP